MFTAKYLPLLKKQHVLLNVFALLIGSATLWLSFHAHNASPANVGTLLIAQYALFTLVMLAVWQSSPTVGCFNKFKWVIFSGIAIRLLLVFVEPYTTNDPSRYLFDGKIAISGFDPYTLANNAPQLAELVKQWQPPQEHLQYPTLYPPIAMGLFSFAAAFGVDLSLLVWKLMTSLASIGVLLIGWKLLKQLGKERHIALIAFSPILILEAGEGAHLDAFSALAVTLGVYFWVQHKVVLLGIAIAAGGLIKLVPLVIALPYFFLLKQFKNRIALFVTTTLIFASGYLLMFALGFYPVGSLGTFVEKWRFGSAVYSLLEQILSGELLLVTNVMVVAIGLFLVGFFAYKNKAEQGTTNLNAILILQACLLIPFIVSPVVFPWYFMPLCVLLAVRPNLPLFVWVYSAPLTYEVLNGFIGEGVWKPQAWPMYLQLVLTVLTFAPLIKKTVSPTGKVAGVTRENNLRDMRYD